MVGVRGCCAGVRVGLGGGSGLKSHKRRSTIDMFAVVAARHLVGLGVHVKRRGVSEVKGGRFSIFKGQGQ